jgi:hypothetical protein
MNIAGKKDKFPIAGDKTLTKDMETIAKNRHDFLLPDKSVDMDKYIDFLTEFNEFINHKKKPFKPIIVKNMKM